MRHHAVAKSGAYPEGKKPYTQAEETERDAEEAAVVAAAPAKKRAKIRAKRDGLLAETDWTRLDDVKASDKVKYLQYRQDLKNIPQQAGFPDSVIWPDAPP